MVNERTTINILKKTADNLKKRKITNMESYDEIINRLLLKNKKLGMADDGSGRKKV